MPVFRRLFPLLLFAATLPGCARGLHLEPAAVSSACTAVVSDVARPHAQGPRRPHVRWLRPADEGDRRAHDEQCAAIGPALVLDRTARVTPAIRTFSQPTLAIAVWNQHAGRGQLRRLVADIRAGVDGTAPPRDFVVLVQEAYRERSRGSRAEAGVRATPAAARDHDDLREDVPDVAREFGLYLFYVPTTVEDPDGAPRGDRGNAILSTRPLTNREVVELPFERQRRVAIAATVHAGPEAVRVVDVHFENRAGSRGWWLRSASARARQAAALVRALPDRGTLVLGGDLNTWSPGEAILDVLRTRVTTWAVEDVRPTFHYGLRLDYLLGRLPDHAVVTQRRLDDRYGSDHYPLVGTIRWPGMADHSPAVASAGPSRGVL
ncbi:MAG TPA: endonuclease/exonuclease/phosphatase family protein [Vicinamibacterales bacterium]